MNETKKKILLIIRRLLRVILFIATFVMLDMFYTIIYPDRYYIFEVNYIFISLYILTAIGITFITVKMNDFFIHKVKFKSDVFMKVVYFTPIIIYLTRFIILISSEMSSTYMDSRQFDVKYSVSNLLTENMIIYICIMIDYFCIRSIIRNIPVCFNRR